MPNASTTADPVFILEYTHRHGSDLAVYETMAAAKHARISTILDWLDDIDSDTTKDQIVGAIADGDFERGFELWADYQRDASYPEQLLITTTSPLPGPDRGDLVANAREQIAALAEASEDALDGDEGDELISH
jgi:hypothetical protein